MKKKKEKTIDNNILNSFSLNPDFFLFYAVIVDISCSDFDSVLLNCFRFFFISYFLLFK